MRARRRAMRIFGGLLLRFVRARRVLRTDVPADHGLRRHGSVMLVRGRVLLALVLRARRHERQLRERVRLRDRRSIVRLRHRLLLERVQQRNVHEGTGLRARGRDLQRQPGLLRASVLERSLRSPRSVPSDGRDLRERRRLLLGIVRGRPMRGASDVQFERHASMREGRGRSVRGTCRVLHAIVRRDERRQPSLRADRRLRSALRALRHGRRLLLGIVRGRRERREAMRGDDLRSGRRALHGRPAVLRTQPVHRGQRVDALRARAGVRGERATVRCRERVLRIDLRSVPAVARMRRVRHGRRALHRELGLLRSLVGLRAYLGRADLCTAHPLMEVV